MTSKERIEYKTKEERQACKMIMNARRYNRINFQTKTLFIKCDMVGIHSIESVLTSRYNTKKNTITFSLFGLRINNKISDYNKKRYSYIHPNKNKKLKCTNKHALDARIKARMCYKKSIRRICFNTTIDNRALLYETISYNKNTGNLTLGTYWRGT